MQSKYILATGLAFCTLLFCTLIATAQQTTPTPTNTPVAQLQPLTAAITQQVPVSLTVRIPGPTGAQTVTIPVILSLHIQVGLARPISPALGISVVAVQPKAPATPTVSLATAAPPAPTPTAQPVLTNTTPAPTGTPPVTATVTATPTKAAVVAPQCPAPGSVITAPGVNQVVSGTVALQGTAEDTNFDYYKLEYAVGANANEAAEYRYFAGGATPVRDGPLGAFDSRTLPNRAYTLRLTVVDKTGNFPPPCQVTVLVQN